MNEFKINGNKVALVQYIITYTDPISGDTSESCTSDEQKNSLESYLKDNNIEFKTEPVDQSSNEWFNGLEFNSYDEALIAFNQGKSYLNASKIAELEKNLSATDYQIIKCYEYSLVGETAPYDIAELHKNRQAIRDQINSLQGSAVV